MGKKFNLYENLDKYDPNKRGDAGTNEPDYLNLEEKQARIQRADAPDDQAPKIDTNNTSDTSAVPTPDDQAPGIDTDDVIGSVALTAPEYDQKRQDQKLNQAKFSALGQAFGGLTDGMTLGLGGRVALREKSNVSDYVDDFQKYNDDFQTKMEDYNYKQYLQRLRAGTAKTEQENLDRKYETGVDEFNQNLTETKRQFNETLGEKIRHDKENKKTDAFGASTNRTYKEDYIDYLNRSLEFNKGSKDGKDDDYNTIETKKIHDVYSIAVTDPVFLKTYGHLFDKEAGVEKKRITVDKDGNRKTVRYHDMNFTPIYGEDIIAGAYFKFMEDRKRVSTSKRTYDPNIPQPGQSLNKNRRTNDPMFSQPGQTKNKGNWNTNNDKNYLIGRIRSGGNNSKVAEKQLREQLLTEGYTPEAIDNAINEIRPSNTSTKTEIPDKYKIYAR